MAKIGIIGGSGITEMFKPEVTKKVDTPYGPPSGDLEIGAINGVKIAFLQRHGKGHRIPPHKINYKANIYAMYSEGVEKVIAISAVGSLKEEYRPGEVAFPDQFIDFTKSREYTYFNGPTVAHISMADPFCESLRGIVIGSAQKLNISSHKGGTYICIEGPRFSTRAESKMFRNFADLIGMTLVPEINLARELGMCYLSIATITDYDVWAEKPVTAGEVTKVVKENEFKVKNILNDSIKEINNDNSCDCKKDINIAKM
ncbi:MAG: S-methyl-5'-thioadenosine phosphorylase [Thermoplasmata archaeon]